MFPAIHFPIAVAHDTLAPGDTSQRLCLGYNSRIIAAWILETLAKFRGV